MSGHCAASPRFRSTYGSSSPLRGRMVRVWATVFSASVVHVTANTAGLPFTMTATEVTAGTGTATRAAVTAATGPNHWDNTANWEGGVLPADTDILYVDNTSVSILYGLDQSAIEPAAMYVGMSFTGEIGLPEINQAGGYHEYRSQYLSLGSVILQVGLGTGNGSGRIKINSTADACALTVFATGSSADNLPAMIWKGTAVTNALVQVGGSLGVAIFGSEVATIATVTKSGGNLLTGAGVTLSGALTQAGGSWTINSAVATSLTQTGGSTVIEGTGAVAQLTLQGGSVTYNTLGTLGGATGVAGNGVLDLGGNSVGVTVSAAMDLFGTSSFINDPNKRVAALIVDGNQGANPGTQVVWGINYRLTRGAVA